MVEDQCVHQGEATIFDLCHQCCTCGNGLGFLLPTPHVKPNAIKSVAVLLSTMRWGCQCWCRRGPKIDWINIHRNRLILQFLIAIWQFTEFSFQSKNNSLKLFQVAFRQHLCPSVTNKLFTTQLKIHKKIRQSGKKVNKNSVHFSFPEKNPKHKVWLWRVRKIQFLALILLFGRG